MFVTNTSQSSDILRIAQEVNKPFIGIKTDLYITYIKLLTQLDKPYTLITVSNDDHCVPYYSYPSDMETHDNRNNVDMMLKNPNLLVWYSKNPCIIHYKIKPLPLGPKWQWKTTRFHGESKCELFKTFTTHCLSPEADFNNVELKKKLLYFNFTTATTGKPLYTPHKNLRQNIKNDLQGIFAWNESKPFEAYLNEIKEYKFCLAPPGRGIDTHRCWEALMVGTIPIVQSSAINDLYIDLPVLILHNWSKITEDYLNTEYENIRKKKYNFSKLYTFYWRLNLLLRN